MKTTKTTLASSPTIEGLTKCLNQYLYSEKYTIDENLTIHHPVKDVNDSFKVIYQKSRFKLIGVYTTL